MRSRVLPGIALLATLFLGLIVATFAQITVNNALINNNVERKIDLTTHVVRHTIKVDVENTGNQAAAEYLVSVPKSLIPHLSIISVRDLKAKQNLEVSEALESTVASGAVLYRARLVSPLPAGETAKLRVKLAFTHVLTPFPAEITQNQQQLVVYNDNHFFYSPYTTRSQKTIVTVASSQIESFSQEQPAKKEGSTITYGPYTDKSAFSTSAMRIHAANNAPFVTVTRLERIFEVSHWGNLAVEEHYEIRHDGAALKGGFSRLDYQRTQGAGSPSSFRQVTAVLPKGASDIYYRDEIGNISTSTVRVKDANVELDIQPRFPMFGGWKVKFYIGYNVPLTGNQSLLTVDAKDSSKLTLTAPFACPIKDAAVDELIVKVILPEGSKDIKVHVPFQFDKEEVGVHKTYLDTTGRPVHTITKKNAVNEHNVDFKVTYSFNTSSMLHEPAILIGSFFLFFLACIAYNRFNLSISKEDASQLDVADITSEVIESITAKHMKRENHYGNIEQAISRFIRERDTKAFEVVRKDEKVHLVNISNSIAANIEKLDQLSAPAARELAGKLRELERKDKEKLALLEQIIAISRDYIERGAKAEAKKQFETQTKQIEKSYDKVSEEISEIYNELLAEL